MGRRRTPPHALLLEGPASERLWYRTQYGRLAERLIAPVLFNRALSRKRGRCQESKSANPLSPFEATPSEAHASPGTCRDLTAPT